jgi:nucleoid DNA-binding protein
MAAKDTDAKAMPKTAVFKVLAERAGLEPKQVGAVFDHLAELILEELGKKGPGQFQLPGLVKFTLVKKPATKATKRMVAGREVEVKAKPATVKVKARTLKTLKEFTGK